MWVVCNRYASLLQLPDDIENHLPVLTEEPMLRHNWEPLSYTLVLSQRRKEKRKLTCIELNEKM